VIVLQMVTIVLFAWLMVAALATAHALGYVRGMRHAQRMLERSVPNMERGE
jgi:hypothetical protein